MAVAWVFFGGKRYHHPGRLVLVRSARALETVSEPLVALAARAEPWVQGGDDAKADVAGAGPCRVLGSQDRPGSQGTAAGPGLSGHGMGPPCWSTPTPKSVAAECRVSGGRMKRQRAQTPGGCTLTRLDGALGLNYLCQHCGCSSMAEQQLPKLNTGVRFPSPAPKSHENQCYSIQMTDIHEEKFCPIMKPCANDCKSMPGNCWNAGG